MVKLFKYIECLEETVKETNVDIKKLIGTYGNVSRAMSFIQFPFAREHMQTTVPEIEIYLQKVCVLEDVDLAEEYVKAMVGEEDFNLDTFLDPYTNVVMRAFQLLIILYLDEFECKGNIDDYLTYMKSGQFEFLKILKTKNTLSYKIKRLFKVPMYTKRDELIVELTQSLYSNHTVDNLKRDMVIARSYYNCI